MPQPPLTPAEKLAGRYFKMVEQEKLTALWEAEPDPSLVHSTPTFVGSAWRHECPGRNMISTALELKEKYIFSPEYRVNVDHKVVSVDGAEFVYRGMDPETGQPDYEPYTAGDIGEWEIIPAERFGFIYKDGVCKAKGCGQKGRSKAGFFTDAYYRPPVDGRVARASH